MSNLGIYQFNKMNREQSNSLLLFLREKILFSPGRFFVSISTIISKRLPYLIETKESVEIGSLFMEIKGLGNLANHRPNRTT
jgi:hypothetical protein